MSKKISVLLTLVILLATFGALSPNQAVAQNPSPKVAVFEFFSWAHNPGCPETGAALNEIALEYQDQPVAIIEWEYSLIEPPNRVEMLYEVGGGTTVPQTMVDSSRMWTRSWYNHYPEYFRQMIDSSLEAEVKADITAHWTRNGDLLTFTGTVTNTSGFELNTANKAKIHAIVYEDYANAQTHDTARIGRGSNKVDIVSLADGDSMDFEINIFPSHVVNWDNLRYVVLVDYRVGPPPINNILYGYYTQLNAVWADELLLEEFEVSPTTITADISENDATMPVIPVTITGTEGQTWSATVDKNFVTLSASTGDVPGGFDLSFDKTKFAEGLNTATVTVVDGAGQFERTITVEVTYRVTELFIIYLPMIYNRQ